MQRNYATWTTILCAVLLALAPLAVAYPHDGHLNMEMGESARPTIPSPLPPPPSGTGAVEATTYFRYGEHTGLMSMHILLMTIAWVFVLPIAVMLSISRTRSALPVQAIFVTLNALGVFLVTIYNASTPDLYPNNAHHKLGWVLTWVVGAQVVVGILSAYAGRRGRKAQAEQNDYIPVSTEAMAEHQRMHSLRQGETYRFSNDSGQGTERNTESLRSHSISSSGDESDLPHANKHNSEEPEEKHGLLRGNRIDRFLTMKIPGLLSSRAMRVVQFVSDIVDRFILLLGFAALLSGGVTYGGLFMGDRVFSGLAHFIKGGVFFWFGVLSLGRWAGCFAELGWAWNIKPAGSKTLSAEFVESLLIFVYGSTNVFLEHLNAWGKEWSAQDFEHISITIMFIGGGLCGMLIESSRVRDLLTQQPSIQLHSSHAKAIIKAPKSYRFSMNPIPALVVLLVGMMMSSHHQESMFSTMVHKQWGTLLVAASFARAATYVVFYLSPPTSVLPGRPPTELITAFCLMAGGGIFMTSARDTVLAMESLGLEPMVVFTVAMGLIMFLMAWIIAVIAIKGWVVRRENRSSLEYQEPGRE